MAFFEDVNKGYSMLAHCYSIFKFKYWLWPYLTGWQINGDSCGYNYWYLTCGLRTYLITYYLTSATILTICVGYFL